MIVLEQELTKDDIADLIDASSIATDSKALLIYKSLSVRSDNRRL